MATWSGAPPGGGARWIVTSTLGPARPHPPAQPSRKLTRSSRRRPATSCRSARATARASSRRGWPPRSTGSTTAPASRGHTVMTSRRGIPSSLGNDSGTGGRAVPLLEAPRTLALPARERGTCPSARRRRRPVHTLAPLFALTGKQRVSDTGPDQWMTRRAGRPTPPSVAPDRRARCATARWREARPELWRVPAPWGRPLRPGPLIRTVPRASSFGPGFSHVGSSLHGGARGAPSVANSSMFLTASACGRLPNWNSPMSTPAPSSRIWARISRTR